MSKKKGWHANWDSTFDLSRGGKELDYRNNMDMIYLLVETKAIQTVNQIIGNIKSENISSRYHVVGDRGLGKSTILNYITYCLFKNIEKEKVLPVNCILETTSSDDKNLELIFFRSLLKHLFKIPDEMIEIHNDKIFVKEMNQLRKAEKQYYELLKNIGEVKYDFIYSGFENQLKHMNKSFDKIVFLIDGLDKQSPERVLKFIRDTQENINYFISKYNCIFIDSADPTWRETLETKEYSGVRGSTILIRPWTPSEVESLIKKRLERIGIFDMPFFSEAIDVIVEDYNGNSRLILQYATSLLDYAYRERIQNIGKGIARDIIWKEDSKIKFYDKIIHDKKIRYAYLKLEDFISDRQALNILIAIYNQKKKILSAKLDYDTRTAYGITLSDNVYKNMINRLENRGCIKSSKIIGYYELEEDVLELFQYSEKLNENIVALPVILQELESKILDEDVMEDETLFLKDEIRQVFTRNYEKWMTYSDIKQSLYYNPLTLKKIENKYGDEYDKNMMNQIPMIVGKFKSEGYLMSDETIKEYKWKPPYLDQDLVNYFQNKEILNYFDNIYQGHRQENYKNVRLYSKELFDLLISNLFAMINKDYKEYNTFEQRKILEYMNVDVTSYTDINNFIAMIQKQPKNKTESDLLIYNIILYSKRLFKQIKELEKINEFNVEKRKILTNLKIGNSYIEERITFNKVFLPLLQKNYGNFIQLMDDLKINKGYVIHIPKIENISSSDILLKGKMYECEECKETHIIKSDNIEYILCNTHKKNCLYKSDVYFLNPKYYQVWNVWMEEYTNKIINNLPIYYSETGFILKTEQEVLSTNKTDEIDLIVIINGKIISLEFKDLLKLEEDDKIIENIYNKNKSLNIFDKVLIVYHKTDNENKLINELSKYKNYINAKEITNPYKFEKELYSFFIKIAI